MGASILIFPSSFVATNLKAVEQLEALNIDMRNRFDATMTKQSKRLLFNKVNGTQDFCSLTRCDYAGSEMDVGKRRGYVMAEGWLVAVERDGEVLDLRPSHITRKRSAARFYTWFATLCLPCFLMAYIRRGTRSD